VQESYHQPDFPVVTLIASIHDPCDFSGLPVYENGRTRFSPPEWSRTFDEVQQGILFLDELTTAPPAVQAALLRVVLERRVGTHALPDNVRIVAAANPPDSVVGGWELSPPLANRFVHIDWELTGKQFADALNDGFHVPPLPRIAMADHRETVPFWRMLTASVLRRDPTLAHTQPADDEYAFASPRTWDYAIQLMATCQLLGKAPAPGGRGSSLFFNLLRGTVGSAAAKTLVGFLKDMRLPNPAKVLDGKESVDIVSLNDDELHVLFCSLGAELARRQTNTGTTCAKPADGVLNGTLSTLLLVTQIEEAGRLDTVFAPLRQLARSQVLQHAAVQAQKEKRMSDFKGLVDRVFSNSPLANYVRCFEGVHESQ
jgi:hypothetical protein